MVNMCSVVSSCMKDTCNCGRLSCQKTRLSNSLKCWSLCIDNIASSTKKYLWLYWCSDDTQIFPCHLCYGGMTDVVTSTIAMAFPLTQLNSASRVRLSLQTKQMFQVNSWVAELLAKSWLYVQWCFMRRWFFKLFVPLPWQPSACIACRWHGFLWAASTVVLFKTKVFPHNRDMTGWRYDRGLASIQFAHGHASLCMCAIDSSGHLKPANLQSTSNQLINRLTVTGSQH